MLKHTIPEHLNKSDAILSDKNNAALFGSKNIQKENNGRFVL